MFIVIMVIAVGAIVIGIKGHDAKVNRLIAEGKCAKRERTFWMQQTTFTTNTDSIDKIYAAMNQSVLNEANIECEVKAGSIMFTHQVSGGSFVATLARLGQSGDKYQYIYQIDGYKGPNGYMKPKCLACANILLTAIEKAFLALDNATAVSRRTASFQHK